MQVQAQTPNICKKCEEYKLDIEMLGYLLGDLHMIVEHLDYWIQDIKNVLRDFQVTLNSIEKVINKEGSNG